MICFRRSHARRCCGEGEVTTVNVGPPVPAGVGRLATGVWPGFPSDFVSLFAVLADGTSHAAGTTLDARAKGIRVVTQNAGHRPVLR